MLPRRIVYGSFLTGIAILIIYAWLVSPTVVPAASLQQEPTPVPEATPTRQPPLSLSDEYCLECHGQPGSTFELQNGELLDLYVPPESHQTSVHGEEGYACVQCHTDVGEYPHPPFEAADRRDVTLQLNGVCQRCHSHQFELAEDDVHAAAQAAGIREAAVCADCHTAHEVRRLTDPTTHELLPETRQWIPERCALCHNAIYQRYQESVHGTALSEGNPDVPTCIDCHGVHSIENPTTSYFRLRSPLICADCHTNSQIMNKYGISTNVLSTYVADFHGTTVAIFEKQSPDAEVNQAVCYDCHGIHDISRTDDPETGIQMKTNLLVRCQACHPDADENFPSAWMSHYTPSTERYQLVYWVDLFYKLFIPLVLGGMGMLVVLDLSRAQLLRRRRRQATALVVDAPESELPAEETSSVDLSAEALPPAEAAPPAVEPPPAELPPVEPPAPPPVPHDDVADLPSDDSEVENG